MPADGGLWRDALIFRDLLRSSDDARARYAAAKQLAGATAASPQEYQDHKRAVVELLKAEARAWHQAGASQP